MKNILIFLILFIPTFLFSQLNLNTSKVDSIKKGDKEKIGYSFYLKTELLNTLIRAMFVKQTYDVDLQASFRLNNKLHLVSTYGKTTFSMFDDIESNERPNVFQHTERTGTAFHRSSLMLRYYPFQEFYNWADFLFVEGGFHFHHYVGKTIGSVFDSTNMVIENKFLHNIEMYRYGPQLNIGMSLYFENLDELDTDYKKPKVIFSPEFYIGVSYSHLDIIKDDFTNTIGFMPNEPYSEDKFRFTFRLKIGIGFL